MKLVCLFLSLVFSIPSLAATSKNVSYKSGDDTVQGILYTPEGKGPFPALVVIHEWWGLNDWVKEQAARLAAPNPTVRASAANRIRYRLRERGTCRPGWRACRDAA